MRLADFILRDMEAILSRWETFAATLLPAAASMDRVALRDHGQHILEAIAGDLRTPQSREAQSEKSMGRAPRLLDAQQTAAETHALLRARSGFDINQLCSEYRALRASVLSLWLDACRLQDSPEGTADMIRFNEAIDQALAESVSFFSVQVDQARNLLLGMLGHDMRSPLQTIQVTATYLAALNAGERVSEAASLLIRSGGRMKALLDDLLDFNRTNLGLGVNIRPSSGDMMTLFCTELDQLRAAYPSRTIELDVVGDTQGTWDGLRLQQLLSNLVVNAIKYGATDRPVRVVITGAVDTVSFEVKNQGPVIERSDLQQIFEPLTRGPQQEADGSLGLGLYIAREIARAHGGDISARSDPQQTVFTVNLPRHVNVPPVHPALVERIETHLCAKEMPQQKKTRRLRDGTQ